MTERKMHFVIVSIIHNDRMASLIAHHYPMHWQGAIPWDHSFVGTLERHVDEKLMKQSTGDDSLLKGEIVRPCRVLECDTHKGIF